MPRIRSIYPEACRSRKAAPSGRVRRDVAVALGAEPNVRLAVACAYCDFVGSITWMLRDGQEIGWVGATGLEWDHIYPEHLGGESTVDNLVLACRSCNRSKGHRTMSEWLCAR